MPVYHFTIHAYRNWRPDHPRGYTRKGEGYKAPDPEMAHNYDEAASQRAVVFTELIQRQILFLAHDICAREQWKLHGAGFDEGHTHLIISWRKLMRWEEVQRRLKNLLALRLNRLHDSPRKRWFVRRHGAPRRVRDRSHLNYLLKTYLPDHPGVFWEMGMPLRRI